ncbi:hypothetical protein BJ742DRAFT_774326 [Cladochytrium replicatum]|nr:hypothetical protein BJ742DRAFT_774326 [Cladochytrium replicatum]
MSFAVDLPLIVQAGGDDFYCVLTAALDTSAQEMIEKVVAFVWGENVLPEDYRLYISELWRGSMVNRILRAEDGESNFAAELFSKLLPESARQSASSRLPWTLKMNRLRWAEAINIRFQRTLENDEFPLVVLTTLKESDPSRAIVLTLAEKHSDIAVFQPLREQQTRALPADTLQRRLRMMDGEEASSIDAIRRRYGAQIQIITDRLNSMAS